MRFIKKYPIINLFHHTLFTYPAPSNLSYLWNFGVLALVCLAFQIITGIFLAMHYVPHAELAFSSVEHIMRDVNFGWLLRYLHANGASMFFLVVYFHVFRGLYYSSYTSPRELLWCTGVIILLLMILTAFLGYVLPWGQMSFWAATVITNLASAIPFGIGDYIVTWLWGGFSVGHATLNRFFSLHYLFPFLILALSFIHLVLLHENGSNNPLGIGFKSDSLSFGPYYLVKDLFGIVIFLFFYFFFCYFMPNYLGHSDNYIMANPLVTPSHIVPEWYFLPFYAILRSVPDKLLGVLLLLGAIFILLALPFLLKVHVRSLAFRPLMKIAFWFFVIDCVLLGWLGGKPIESPYLEVGKFSTLFYFYYFLLFLPAIKLFENFIWFTFNTTNSHKLKVGALTSKPYSFQARPWELASIESYDVLDAVASAIRIDLRGSKVLRILPRNNPSLNQQWISDRTRFSYDSFFTNRLLLPHFNHNLIFIESSWDNCFSLLKDIFFTFSNVKKLSFIPGNYLDFFSLIFFKSFLTKLGSNYFFFQRSSDLREKALFDNFSSFNDINSTLVLSSNMRQDVPILYLRLKKQYANSASFSFFLYGSRAYRLTFPSFYLGINISNLLNFFLARSAASSFFDINKCISFWGRDFSLNNYMLLKHFKPLSNSLYYISDCLTKNNANEISLFSRFSHYALTDSSVFIFMNIDKISTEFFSLMKNKFSLLIATHKPEAFLDFNVFMPYPSFLEDNFFFINSFGTFFKTAIACKSSILALPSASNLARLFSRKLLSFVHLNIFFSFWYFFNIKKILNFDFLNLKNQVLVKGVISRQFQNNFYTTNMWTKNSWNLTLASKYFFKKKNLYHD